MAAIEIKGGQKLAATLARLAASLKQGATLRVGFLEGATYPNGTSVALVGAVQNFGAPKRGIPARPFFSGMVKSKSGGWGAAVAANLRATNYDVPVAMARVGEGIKGQLQQSIRDLWAPPLAPATVKRKGFDKPLIDTGHMINSVAYAVDKG